MNKLSRRFSGNRAKLLPSKRKRHQRRRLMAESLEDRRLLAVDFNLLHNYEFPTDVNGDQHVSPIDALVAINYINGSTGLSEGEVNADHTMKPDVNGDGHVSPLDVLNVINDLAEGEAGRIVTFSHQATDLEGNVVTSVAVGETFVVQTLVQDMRGTPQGLFAAYLDLDYDESLVQVNQRESQTVALRNNPTGGTFQLSFDGQLTAPIAFTDRLVFGPIVITEPTEVAKANANAIEEALLALSNVNLGDVEVVPLTGGTVTGDFRFNFEVKFGGQYAGTDVPKMVASGNQLTNSGGNAPTVTVFNTSDELLVPTLEELQQENPNTTPADRAALVARSEAIRSFTFAFPKYSSGQSGAFAVAAPGSSNMIIDEIGAFTSNQSPGGGELEVLVEIQVTALAGGTATFLGNTADRAPDHDVLVFGIDNAIPSADIGFMPFDLPITSDITALPDTATVDFNGGPIFIDVLANDSIATGTGPTITAPIPTTSANGGTVAQAQVGGINGFNYTPATGFSGTDTFNYTITNGTSTASTNVTITVGPGDNRPAISGPNSLNTNEDTLLSLSGFTITDPDSTNISVTLSAAGTLSQTTFSGTPQQVTSTLNDITYTPVLNSTTADTLTISANDGEFTGTKTVNITINPINDPPINTVPGPQSLFNTETLAFTAGQFSVSDVDNSTLEVTLTITDQATSQPSAGTLSIGTTTGLQVTNNNSNSLTLNGTISALNNGLGTLVYDPLDTFTGTDTLTMTSSDGLLSDTDTVSLTVTPPQIPFAANDFYTANEGTSSFVLTPNPLDNDVSDAGATLNVTDVSPLNAQGGSVAFSNGTFTYTPPSNPDFFGTETFTYTIEQDPAPSSTGNTSDSGTITIEILPINDGPINSVPGPRTVNEDTTLSFTGANLISITDIDAGTGNVTVTLTASNGTINVPAGSGVSNNGTQSVKIDGTVSQINNTLGGLTYTPQLNFFGSDTLSINTNDNGNTGGGGALSDTDTVNITIQPINDPPTIVVPGSQSFFTDFDNRFSNTPNPFQISDIDAGSNNVQVDLTIGDGTLSISNTSGVTISQNPGGSNGIRLTGSISNINSALASGVDYRTSTPGNKSLNAVVNDLGNTGGGGQLTASGTVQVEVLDFVPIDISGFVFLDDNGNGHRDSHESGIGGVSISLSGIDFQGNSLSLSTKTNSHGNYAFSGVRPNQVGSPYTLTELQPAFIQNKSSATDQARIQLSATGNIQVTSGSLDFAEDGFTSEFADVWRLFALSEQSPNNSGILFGMKGSQEWSIFAGDGWDLNRYGDARFVPGGDGNSGVLTVFDSQTGQDRSVNVSTQAGNLTYRGTGNDRVYRVIGGSSLLAGSSTSGEGESDSSAFAAGVDALFASGGL